MVDALIVSNIVLWILVVILAAMVVALMRQIGVLHERVAPAGALMASAGPKVGERAPVLQLHDWSGAPRTIGAPDTEGAGTLLLFVSPTCPICKTILEIVPAVLQSEKRSMRLVLASDGPRDEHEIFAREHVPSATPYVLSAELGLAYAVAKLPYAVLIDTEGVIRAKGLVNTREHLESLFQAEEHGVASLQDYLQREQDARRVA